MISRRQWLHPPSLDGDAHRLLWVDAINVRKEQLSPLLERLGVPDGVRQGLFGPDGRLTAPSDHGDGVAWLGRSGSGVHVVLGPVGCAPGYDPKRGLHVLASSGLIVTARDMPYPGLAFVWHQSRSCATGVPEILAGLLEPLLKRARGEARRLVDRGELVNRAVVERPSRVGETWDGILRVRRDSLHLKRRLVPLGGVIDRVMRDPAFPQGSPGQDHLEVLRDRLSDIEDTLDSLREAMASTVEAYASIQSNRLGHTMEVLTVLSVVFLPATLIASIYGMNFTIPETHWRFGYAYSLILMAAVTVALLLYARYRKWLR